MNEVETLVYETLKEKLVTAKKMIKQIVDNPHETSAQLVLRAQEALEALT